MPPTAPKAPPEASPPAGLRVRARPPLQSPRVRRWAPPLLLVAIMALVMAVNHSWLQRAPFPPTTQHRAYMLVPRFVRLLQGYQPRPVSPDYMDASGKSYALPDREPIPWTSPSGLLAELRPPVITSPHAAPEGGRLSLLFGHCGQSFYTCMPHASLALAVLAWLLPVGAVGTTMGVTLYLLMLLAAAYGIGHTMKGPWAGIAAAAIAASYPGLFGFSRWPEGYLPATALATAMVFLLISSKGLRRWLNCAMFVPLAYMAIRNGEGLAEGIGAGLAVLGPFVVVLLTGLVEDIRRKALPWRTLVGAAIIAAPLLISFDWAWFELSFTHVDDGFDEWYQQIQPGWENPSTNARMVFAYGGYTLMIYAQYLKPLMTGWLLLALPVFLLRRSPHRLSMVLWFLIPMVAYSMMPRKALWYALQVVPPLALITAVGLASIKRHWLRRALMIAACVTGLLQFTALSVPIPLPGFRVPLYLQRPLPPGWYWARDAELIAPNMPMNEQFRRHCDDFLAYLDEQVPVSDELKLVGVLSPWGADVYFAQAFTWTVNLERPDIEAIPLSEAAFINNHPYAGLEVADFAFFIRLDEGAFTPCCDEGGRVLTSFPERTDGVPPALTNFTTRLVRSARGESTAMPHLLVLGHPEVAHLPVNPR